MTETHHVGRRVKYAWLVLTGMAKQYFKVGLTTKRAQHTMILTYMKTTRTYIPPTERKNQEVEKYEEKRQMKKWD